MGVRLVAVPAAVVLSPEWIVPRNCYRDNLNQVLGIRYGEYLPLYLIYYYHFPNPYTLYLYTFCLLPPLPDPKLNYKLAKNFCKISSILKREC